MNRDSEQRVVFKSKHWHPFATIEGLVKAVNITLLKSVSLFMSPVPAGFVLSFVAGLVEASGGLIMTLRSKYRLIPGGKIVVGLIFLGLVSAYTFSTSVFVLSFEEVSLVVIAYMMLLGRIPEAILGKLSKKAKWGLYQWVGILFVIVSLYSFVGFTSVTKISEISTWIWLSLTLPLASLVHNVVTHLFSTAVVSPWVKSFWEGISMTVFSLIAIIIFSVEKIISFSSISSGFWLVFIGVGVLILVATFSKQRAYNIGGIVTSKKITMLLVTLVATFLIGWIVFSESISSNTLISISTALVSYLLIEEHFLRNSLTRRK